MELYESAIRRAVSVLNTTINHNGLVQEDYEAILIAHLWQYGLGDYVDQDLVNTILQNKICDFQRRNKHKTLFISPSAGASFYDLEQETIDRQLIRLVRLILSSDDWGMLVLYVENDFNIRQTWERHSSQTSYASFYVKLQRLLLYCREVIQVICNYRSGERITN